jgi:hypothetical protein
LVVREGAWHAPQGSGGIQLTYRPGAIGQTATLLESLPLRIQVSATSNVVVSWIADGSQTTLRIPVEEAVGRPLNIHWRCDSTGWTLEADGNTRATKAAGLPCVDSPTDDTIAVGSRKSGIRPIDGQLSVVWYADGSQSPPAPGEQPGPNPENVAFVGDFETGDLTQWNAISEIVKLGYGVNASAGKARNGRFAGRMEVRFLDRGTEEDGTPKKVRAEVLESAMKVGSEWWYGWSSMIDAEWADQENTWYIIQQFHQHGLGSPPLFQRYAGGKWSIRCLTGICGGNGPLWEEKVPKGQWVDFIYNIKWSPDDDGFIRVWKDGEQIVDYRGPTCYEANRGPYHKFGIYRGGKDEMTQIIWHDEYRRGTTKSAVDPRSYE